MNTLKNSVQLIGHLGNDPQIKTFDSGKKNASMRIATTDRYFSQNEWVEETQWHNLVMWGTLAEKAQETLIKGSHILIEGKLTHRSYVDAKGENRYFTAVNVNNFILLDKRQNTEETPVSTVEDDLPF